MGWRASQWAGVVCVAGLTACAPTPPLEVIQEAPPVEIVTLNPTPQAETLPPIRSDGTAPPLDPQVALPPAATEEPEVEGDPFDTVVVNDGGLVERLPNTCKLQNYQGYVGQQAAVLPAAALDRPWRVVEPDGIVSQEYDPARLNFQTDRVGTIERVTCG